ncbi:MAG: HAMP domain-containing sensor histidine kinase [Candidatus Paceibacterota bacterium]
MGKLFQAFQTPGFRLPRYFLAIEAISLVAYLFSSVIPFLFPQFFNWIQYKNVWFALWISIFCVNILIITALYFFKNDYVFYAGNYIHIIFHLVIIYITGGLMSPFFVLLVIPLLISAIYLNAKEIGIIGAILIVAYGSFAFLPPYPYKDPNMIAWLGAQLLNYAIIVILMYRVVRETLRQRYERQRAGQIIAEQAELDRIKSTFIDVVSHRLRTPLSGILWGLRNVLDKEESGEDPRVIIQKSFERAERAMDIVNTMIETAELDTKNLNLKLNIKKVELRHVLETAIDDLSFLSSNNNVSVNFDAEQNVTVNADPTILTAALTNIIDNAIRYSPDGEVDISLGETGGGAVITVSDTGIGIPTSDQTHLFDRLYRAQNAIKLSPNNTGIGLYNARRVIEMHGGTIKVESEVGRGTTVTVTL